MKSRTAVIATLGCRLNQADSALITDRLKRIGFDIISQDSGSSPNLIIVNSCTVTATAFKKSRQLLRSLRTENPDSFIVFTGCAAVTEKDALNDCEDIDLLLTNEQKKSIDAILPRYLAYLEEKPSDGKKEKPCTGKHLVFRENAFTDFAFRTRSIIKVQEGCNNKCSYCIVPYARGEERSRDAAETLEDVKRSVDAGFKEIVLSGVNICNYNAGGMKLADLVEKISGVIPDDCRIRLSSTEPGEIVPELADVIRASNGKVCAFLHLPLQNGSDAILKAMGRHCMTEEYASYVEAARKAVPNIHIGTDVITGFPGETEKLFEESFEFLRKMKFANMHVFPFSPRKGTPAAEVKNDVSPERLAERVKRLQELKKESAEAFAASLEGTREKVLIEKKYPNDVWEGWSGNYVRTRIKSSGDVAKKLISVVIGAPLKDGLAVRAKIASDDLCGKQ